MTIEEAIRFHEESLAGAIFIGDKQLADACRLSISALRAQQEQIGTDIDVRTNTPLTLDELREMDGEPVWIQADHYGVYADVVHIIGREDGELFVGFKINYRLQGNGCGKTWQAYRHKPEELITNRKQQTNADRIRAMTDEELAKEMCSHSFAIAAHLSEKAWLKWLQQPYEGGE